MLAVAWSFSVWLMSLFTYLFVCLLVYFFISFHLVIASLSYKGKGQTRFPGAGWVTRMHEADQG